MAYTAPGTAVAGDVLTAAFWNSNVRDNISDHESRILKIGLTHIKTVTMTAAASTDVTSVFSSTYQNYRVIINASTSYAPGGDPLKLNMLSGTTPLTASSYYYAATGFNSTGSIATDAGNAVAYGVVGVASQSGVGKSCSSIDICNPNAGSDYISYTSQTGFWSGGVWFCRSYSGLIAQNVAYDGFRISSPASTFTGTIRVYGYLNS